AEDGIRVRNVTGVQTCALPIFDTQGRGPPGFGCRWYETALRRQKRCGCGALPRSGAGPGTARFAACRVCCGWRPMPRGRRRGGRSEERRVGEEGRARRRTDRQE